MEDYYVIPDAVNVSSIELEEAHIAYDIERKGKNAKGILVWHLIPRSQGNASKEIPSGELPGSRGVRTGQKTPHPFFKNTPDAVEPVPADKPAPAPKTDGKEAEPEPDSEPRNADGGNNGPTPEPDTPSASRAGNVKNFIALQMPNEAQEYRGAVTIVFSDGFRVSPLNDRPSSRFGIGSHTVGDINAIVVGATTYRRGEWSIEVVENEMMHYTLLKPVEAAPVR
jgi:hypothetical protein